MKRPEMLELISGKGSAEGCLSPGRLELLYAKLAALLSASLDPHAKAGLVEQVNGCLRAVSREGERVRLPNGAKEKWLTLHWTLFQEFADTLTQDNFETAFPVVWALGRGGATAATAWLAGASAKASADTEAALVPALHRIATTAPRRFVPSLCPSLLPAARAVLGGSGLDDVPAAALLDAVQSLVSANLSLHLEAQAAKGTEKGQCPPPRLAQRLEDAVTASLLLLRLAQERLQDPAHCLALLRRHATLHGLQSLLSSSCASESAELVGAALELVSSVLRAPEGLAVVEGAGLLDLLSLQLLDRLTPALGRSDPDPKEVNLLRLALEAERSGLSTHGHRFLWHAQTFVGAYGALLGGLLDASSRAAEEGGRLPVLSAAIAAVGLLRLLAANHRSAWISELGPSFGQMRDAVRKATLQLIGAVSRGLLHRGSGGRGVRTTEDSPLALAQSQRKSVELLLACLEFLRAVSPDLPAFVGTQSVDTEAWELVLELEYGSAVGPEDERLGFGAAFLLVQIAVSALRKAETPGRSGAASASASASPSLAKASAALAAAADKEVVSVVLEMGVELTLSQAALALAKADVAPEAKHQLQRELSSELQGLLNRCLRYAGGSPFRSSGSRSPRSQSRSLSPAASAAASAHFHKVGWDRCLRYAGGSPFRSSGSRSPRSQSRSLSPAASAAASAHFHKVGWDRCLRYAGGSPFRSSGSRSPRSQSRSLSPAASAAASAHFHKVGWDRCLRYAGGSPFRSSGSRSPRSQSRSLSPAASAAASAHFHKVGWDRCLRYAGGSPFRSSGSRSPRSQSRSLSPAASAAASAHFHKVGWDRCLRYAGGSPFRSSGSRSPRSQSRSLSPAASAAASAHFHKVGWDRCLRYAGGSPFRSSGSRSPRSQSRSLSPSASAAASAHFHKDFLLAASQALHLLTELS